MFQFLFIHFLLTLFPTSLLPLHEIVPVLSQGPHEEWHLEKIEAGLSNQNFLLKISDQSYFLRLGTIGLLGNSIEKEYASTLAAASLGIAPTVALFIPEKQILITKFIQPCKSEINLRHLPTLKKLTKSIKILHDSDISWPSIFSPIDCIKDFYQKASSLGIEMPESVRSLLLPKLASLEKQILPRKKVPCHLDLHMYNMVDDGTKLWLIDWECAALADPLFDLATLSSNEHFSDEEMNQLLSFYNHNEDPSQLYLMRILADARWAVWSYLQIKNSQIDFDYRKMGDDYLHECLTRLKAFYE